MPRIYAANRPCSKLEPIQEVVTVEVFPIGNTERSDLLSFLYSRLGTFKAIFEDSIEFVQTVGNAAVKQRELPNVQTWRKSEGWLPVNVTTSRYSTHLR